MKKTELLVAVCTATFAWLIFVSKPIVAYFVAKINTSCYNEDNGGALEILMQNYTLENLISIIRKRLQDEEFDSTTLTIFLNESLNEILGEDKYPFMQRIDKYTADDKGEIAFPIGYGGTFYIYARKEKQPRQEVKYIEPEEFFKDTKRHTFVYTVFANSIFYRLRNDPEDIGYEITHLYLINPLPLVNSTDITPIPPQYIEALILGAMARAEEIRDNFDFSQIYRNQQDQILTNMKLRYGPGNLTAQNRAKLPFFGGYSDGRI